ncbi:MAG: helix-turn-helix domain-containing protein [Streptosporangiaceae bacterium]|nr:helix-turn-helix domain-containing protein [Streptosporangiaceae bacterium]
MSSGPTVHRRQLGAELRRLREAAGLRTEDAAKALSCSHTRISRIESGKGGAVAKPGDVRALCDLYGITDERTVETLLDMLTVASRQRGWWEAFEGILPSGLSIYVGLESGARAELGWEPLLIHGLLQTADYARAVFKLWGTNRPHDIDDLVEVRTERQKLLTREGSPLELWAVFDEAAIVRPLGGTQIMRDQLRHLASVTDLSNVTIQVIPFRSGGHPGLGGAFSILEFEEDEPVAYIDCPAGNLYLEKKHDIRTFMSTFDLLRAMALPPDESRALINRAAEEMK